MSSSEAFMSLPSFNGCSATTEALKEGREHIFQKVLVHLTQFNVKEIHTSWKCNKRCNFGPTSNRVYRTVKTPLLAAVRDISLIYLTIHSVIRGANICVVVISWRSTASHAWQTLPSSLYLRARRAMGILTELLPSLPLIHMNPFIIFHTTTKVELVSQKKTNKKTPHHQRASPCTLRES